MDDLQIHKPDHNKTMLILEHEAADEEIVIISTIFKSKQMACMTNTCTQMKGLSA